MITRTIREIIEAQKTATVPDLMTPQVEPIALLLGATVSHLDPADVAVALALIFGSLCFDAEMQAALNIGMRGQTDATFEDRLELFGVHAKIGYEGVKAYAKEEQPYNDGRKTN